MSNRTWLVIIAVAIVTLVVSFLAGNIAVQFTEPSEETVIVESNDRYTLPVVNRPAALNPEEGAGA